MANSKEDAEYFLSPAEMWPDYSAYIKQVVPENLFSQADLERPEDLLHDLHGLRKGDVLLTLAQTVALDWNLSTFEDSTGISLLSPTGDSIGEITLLLADQTQYAQLPTLWGPTVEVMGISLAILTAPGEGANWPPGKFVHVDGQDFPDIPVVNVLVVEKKGKCLRRRALGWICLGDWVRLEGRWEYLLLE